MSIVAMRSDYAPRQVPATACDDRAMAGTTEVLHGAVRDAMARYGVPGVAFGLIDGAEESLAGFGVTSVDEPRPVDDETLFQVASITKTVVATAVLRLVERGSLELDAPLVRYVPELRLRDPATTEQLTLTHLLTHTGGFQGDVAFGAFGVDFGGEAPLTRFVEVLAHLPQHAPPGEIWFYNNVGFLLAGRVIEVATGLPFDEAIDRLVLAPLGMRRSGFALPADASVAVGHRIRDGQPEVVARWRVPRWQNPAGGLICPATDLVRYARFHLGDGRASSGERLLSAESMERMRLPRVADALHNGCLASFADEVGLSWFSRPTPRGRLLVHGGWTSLAHRLTLLPERGLAIFVLTNAPMGAQLHAEVTKLVLRELAGIDGLDAAPMAVLPDALLEFGGIYRFVTPDIEDVVVRATGDRLEIGEWGPAAVYAPDRVVALAGEWRHERGHFLRGPDGRVTHLRMGGGLGQRIG
jgi:CubicO group peptidase (beta-lactamase class C family)